MSKRLRNLVAEGVGFMVACLLAYLFVWMMESGKMKVEYKRGDTKSKSVRLFRAWNFLEPDDMTI